MSFFRREAESESQSSMTRTQPSTSSSGSAGAHAAGARDRAVTRIADGTRIVGEVTGATEILVDGEVEGQLRVESRVVVGQGGAVHGEITARSILVAGTVKGNLRGSERVEVGGSGKLEGDISAPRVTIAEGAFFKGKVEMAGGEGGRRPGGAERAPLSSGEPSSGDLFPEGREGEGRPPEGESPGGGGQ